MNNYEGAIVLYTPDPKKKVCLTGVVRVNEHAEMELHRLAEETGLSLKTVASDLITQAARICVIERG